MMLKPGKAMLANNYSSSFQIRNGKIFYFDVVIYSSYKVYKLLFCNKAGDKLNLKSYKIIVLEQ